MSRRRTAAGLTSVLGSDAESASGERGRAVVVGGGHVGRSVASHLNDDHDVSFLSRRAEVVERTAHNDVSATHVEEFDAAALDAAGAGDAAVAVIAAQNDGRNLLVAQLLRTRFDVPHVVSRVNDRDKLDSFDALGVETVPVADLLVDEVTNRLETGANDAEDA
jgi:Trk K+ transport system NAD-binding subunit